MSHCRACFGQVAKIGICKVVLPAGAACANPAQAHNNHGDISLSCRVPRVRFRASCCAWHVAGFAAPSANPLGAKGHMKVPTRRQALHTFLQGRIFPKVGSNRPRPGKAPCRGRNRSPC